MMNSMVMGLTRGPMAPVITKESLRIIGDMVMVKAFTKMATFMKTNIGRIRRKMVGALSSEPIAAVTKENVRIT